MPDDERFPSRVPAKALHAFAGRALVAAGLGTTHADEVATTLVDADLLGYTTHGVGLLPMYVRQLRSGQMRSQGTIEVLRQGHAHALLDGSMLPGPVVLRHAVRLALELAADEPVVTIVIRRTANTACLATYLPCIAQRGLISSLQVGNPDNRAVAPPGTGRAAYGTDPIAFCAPTRGDPVLIDFATSATTNRMTERARRSGEPLPFEALVDAAGRPCADAAVLDAEPPGALAPLGAPHAPHKGFALAMWVELLTGCLGGAGRLALHRHEPAVGSTSLLQVIDPEFFAGRERFLDEAQTLMDSLQRLPNGEASGARLPGQRAFARRREQLASGIELHPDLPPLLESLARQLDVEPPTAR